MRIKRIRRFNLSKDLAILRAFVDAIRVWNGNIYLSAAYRRGRTFCCYDSRLKIRFRIEEEDLKKNGFGDYRCFTVDSYGNMIIAGRAGADTIVLIILDQSGKISETHSIDNFPLLESIAVDGNMNIYLHSPAKDHPIYKVSPGIKEITGFGNFPGTKSSIENRVGRIEADNRGNLNLIMENYPWGVFGYDQDGKETFIKGCDSAEPSIDYITRILDASTDPDNGNLFLLMENEKEGFKLLEVIDSSGNTIKTMRICPKIRRISKAPGDILYSSETIFSIGAMLASGGIYGAITTIDVNVIEK